MTVFFSLCLSAAHAGPVPMFTGGVVPSAASPPATHPAVGPSAAGPSGTGPQRPAQAFVPILIGDDPHAFVPTPLQAPQPTQPPLLPYVPAEPVKRRVANPGRLTPIEEVPSAFRPLEQAPNRLPVVYIREKRPAQEAATQEPPTTALPAQ